MGKSRNVELVNILSLIDNDLEWDRISLYFGGQRTKAKGMADQWVKRQKTYIHSGVGIGDDQSRRDMLKS